MTYTTLARPAEYTAVPTSSQLSGASARATIYNPKGGSATYQLHGVEFNGNWIEIESDTLRAWESELGGDPKETTLSVVVDLPAMGHKDVLWYSGTPRNAYLWCGAVRNAAGALFRKDVSF